VILHFKSIYIEERVFAYVETTVISLQCGLPRNGPVRTQWSIPFSHTRVNRQSYGL